MLTTKGIDEKIYRSTDRDTDYKEKGFYLCRECEKPAFLRKCNPNYRINHFAHYPGEHSCNPWEPDTQDHLIMKDDVFNYFKNLPWVKDIDSETPIPYSDGIIRPDVYITTNNNDKIAIECQITKLTKLQILEKVKKYSDMNISTLFIFHKKKYIRSFLYPNITTYISPDIIVMDNIIVHRFYLYNYNDKNKEKYGTIVSFEQIGARVTEKEDDNFYFMHGYINRCDFKDYTLHDADGYKIVAGNEKPNFGKIVNRIEHAGYYFDSEWNVHKSKEKSNDSGHNIEDNIENVKKDRRKIKINMKRRWGVCNGRAYLMVDVVVENVGYQSFEINPSYFYVVIYQTMKIQYVPLHLPQFYKNLSQMREVLNGEKVITSIAFELPITHEFYIIYDSPSKDYNIEYSNYTQN